MDDLGEPRPVPPELWALKDATIADYRARTAFLDAYAAAEAAGHDPDVIEWWARGTGWDEEPPEVDDDDE